MEIAAWTSGILSILFLQPSSPIFSSSQLFERVQPRSLEGQVQRFPRHEGPDTLKVSLVGSFHSAPKVGFNANWLALPSRDGRLLDSLRTFRPHLIRYPGGGVGDHWDWQEGWIDEATLTPEREVWAEFYDQRPQTLQQLKAVVEHVGAKPLFALNLLTSSVAEQMNMLRTAEEMGLPVKYVELGNEYYFGYREKNVEVFPTGKEYAAKAQAMAEHVREEFPQATIAPIATFSRPELPSRRREWNGVVKTGVRSRDAVALHPYANLHLLDEKAGAGRNALQYYGDVLRTVIQNKLEQGFNMFPSDPIWATEYTVRYEGSQLRDTWTHGVLTGAYTSLLVQNPRIRVLLAHEINGASQDMRAIKTKRWGKEYSVTTYGTALRVLFRTLSKVDTVYPLRFDATASKGVATQKQEATQAILVGTRYGGSRAVIVNMRTTEQVLDLRSVFPGREVRSRVFSYPSPLKKQVRGEEVTRQTERTDGVVSVPPFSITKILSVSASG